MLPRKVSRTFSLNIGEYFFTKPTPVTYEIKYFSFANKNYIHNLIGTQRRRIPLESGACGARAGYRHKCRRVDRTEKLCSHLMLIAIESMKFD